MREGAKDSRLADFPILTGHHLIPRGLLQGVPTPAAATQSLVAQPGAPHRDPGSGPDVKITYPPGTGPGRDVSRPLSKCPRQERSIIINPVVLKNKFIYLFVCLFLSPLLFIYLFIYFWLYLGLRCCARLSLVVASRGYSSLWCAGFSLWWPLLLRSTSLARGLQ